MSSDWDTVTVLRKKAPKASAMKTESAVNQVSVAFWCVRHSQREREKKTTSATFIIFV